MIHWNGQPLHAADDLLESALDRHFAGKKKWHFITRSNKPKSVVISRLKGQSGRVPWRVLVDTGDPDVPEYIENLKDALTEYKCGIQEILITHWHIDHIGGISAVYENIPSDSTYKISKLKRPGHEEEIDGLSNVRYNFMKDNEEIQTEGATIQLIHTPGHTTDHLALYLKEEHAIFSGDCVLGQGTAVFEDLYDYMNSLQKLIKLKPQRIYPAHGPVLENATEVLEKYVNHRNIREKQIMNEIKSSSEPVTARDLVRRIYVDTPSSLLGAAEVNVIHHLEKLFKEKKIEKYIEYKHDFICENIQKQFELHLRWWTITSEDAICIDH
eukprot:gene11770-12987_t